MTDELLGRILELERPTPALPVEVLELGGLPVLVDPAMPRDAFALLDGSGRVVGVGRFG